MAGHPAIRDLSDAVGEHGARHGTGPSGSLFRNITGTLVTTSDYSTQFRKVVKTLGYEWSPMIFATGSRRPLSARVCHCWMYPDGSATRA